MRWTAPTRRHGDVQKCGFHQQQGNRSALHPLVTYLVFLALSDTSLGMTTDDLSLMIFLEMSFINIYIFYVNLINNHRVFYTLRN